MITDESLRVLRDHVAKAFAAGTSTFPHYTLHGREHLDELDRITLLIGGYLNLAPDRLNLLRMAVIMHDFAMVDVPSHDREAELRRQLNKEMSFADVVRKTHQDEIRESFSRDEKINFLLGLPGVNTHIIEDAVLIAAHHRFHPLALAPRELRDLCALMRAIDEFEIGPRRAPIETYSSLRIRMEREAKLHWLKHICTRQVDSHGTFVVEQHDNHRILKVYVRVQATENSWRPLQRMVIEKLKKCLDLEGINRALEILHTEFQVEPHPASGPSRFLNTVVRDDLNDLFPDNPPEPDPPSRVPPSSSKNPPATPEPSTDTAAMSGAPMSGFDIIATPPEELANLLCRSGRLTVIQNTYIDPGIEHIAGKQDVSSRIYFGPADCGKTRAALEWIQQLTASRPSQWVILRTGMGTIPDTVDRIVLDTTAYQKQGFQLPQKAILLADDLPLNLPQPSPLDTDSDGVGRLFRWFGEHPAFRERVLVATIRAEDVCARPGWPETLPTLGLDLALVRLKQHDIKSYRRIWEGMTRGAVSPSMSQPAKPFELTLEPAFLDAVSKQEANPEAVAAFINQHALSGSSSLTAADAERFSTDAVKTWLSETWPAIHAAYGIHARVFYTLARFLEAGLRPESGYIISTTPAWQFHHVLGAALSAREGASPKEYAASILRMKKDGHATGVDGKWIRPRFDFLLQAESLPSVDLQAPSFEWLLRTGRALSEDLRYSLGVLIGASNLSRDVLVWPAGFEKDALLLVGLGIGRGMASDHRRNASISMLLLDDAIGLLGQSLEDSPTVTNNRRRSVAHLNLGVGLGKKSDKAKDHAARDKLRDEEIAAYRNALDADPKLAQAWSSLGTRLGQKADEANDHAERDKLRDEEIAAYRNALDADPKLSQAWSNLGVRLGQKADEANDPAERDKLRDEEIAAYRNALDADPKLSQTWSNLGSSLGQKADEANDPAKRDKLREEEIVAYCNAVNAAPKLAQAWSNLGFRLGQKADEAKDPAKRDKLRDEAIAAYRNAVDADPKLAGTWSSLGARLGQKANEAMDSAQRDKLREEAIAAHQKAVDADPNFAQAWYNFSALLLHLNRVEEALDFARQAATLGASHYNLACALARSGRASEALTLLAKCLLDNEITKAHVAQDSDWISLRAHPEFIRLFQTD